MTAELYIHKALLQFSRGQDARAVESLHTSLDLSSNDIVSATEAQGILAEYFFIHQQ